MKVPQGNVRANHWLPFDCPLFIVSFYFFIFLFLFLSLWLFWTFPRLVVVLKSKAALSVPLHVKGEMVAPRKRSLTEMALERFLARVLAIVSRKLVRACELPRAALPRALIRFLACVSPLVGFQVGTFRVDLVTARDVASVDLAPLQCVAALAVDP